MWASTAPARSDPDASTARRVPKAGRPSRWLALQPAGESCGSRCLRVEIVLCPTETQRRAYDDAAKSFGTTLAELRSLIDGELRDLQRDLDEAGVPWTSGRLPRWERTEEF